MLGIGGGEGGMGGKVKVRGGGEGGSVCIDDATIKGFLTLGGGGGGGGRMGDLGVLGGVRGGSSMVCEDVDTMSLRGTGSIDRGRAM